MSPGLFFPDDRIRKFFAQSPCRARSTGSFARSWTTDAGEFSSKPKSVETIHIPPKEKTFQEYYYSVIVPSRVNDRPTISENLL